MMKCHVCEMYILPEHPKVYLKQQLERGFPVTDSSECNKCSDLKHLKKKNDDLANEILQLQQAITNLRHIRVIEKEIDLWLSNVTNQNAH